MQPMKSLHFRFERIRVWNSADLRRPTLSCLPKWEFDKPLPLHFQLAVERAGSFPISLVSMPHGFDAYRVFISAPGDLEKDRQACHDAIASVNESVAMPAKVLLVSVGLRDNAQIEGNRGIVSDNVRWSSFFVQLFQDDWGPRSLFRKLFLLSLDCRDDGAMAMRDVVVCLKDAPHERDAEVLEFRSELEGRANVQLIRYSNPEHLKQQLEDVLRGWAESVISEVRSSAPQVDSD
jgi:hypothetical protein